MMMRGNSGKLGSESNFSDLSSFGTTPFSYDVLSRPTTMTPPNVVVANYT